MTPLSAVVLGGMLIALGIVLAVHSLRPAPPQLAAALSQLRPPPGTGHIANLAPSRPVRVPIVQLLPTQWRVFLERHVGARSADLAILDLTRSQLLARMISGALAGLLVPPAVAAVLAALGTAPPVSLPAGAALGLAAALWWAPARRVRANAAAARAQFTAALRAFLTLVAQERASRGSPVEALEEASRPWHGWPFRMIHSEVLRAELAGDTPWDALRGLGDRLGIDELRVLCDVVATAADGAAVFDTLLAEARTLHHAELAAQHASANAASERLVQPLALLAVGFVLLVLIPPLLRLFGT